MKKTIQIIFMLFLLILLVGCSKETKKQEKYDWPFEGVPVAEKKVNDIQEVATGKYATITEYTKKSFLKYVSKLEREGFECIASFSTSDADTLEEIADTKIEENGFLVWRGSNNNYVVEVHWYDIEKYNEKSDEDVSYNLKVKVWKAVN